MESADVTTDDATTALIEQYLADPKPIGFDAAYGLRFTALTPDGVVAKFAVGPQQQQPWGIVHGGVYASVIESVGSMSGQVWLGAKGNVVGVNNNTDFLRSVSEGNLTATSTPIHRGRRQQLWLVEITDENDRLIARGQLRLQNLENPTPAPQ